MKILDYGSITLVESWGSDERIIEAARMSTGKGFQGWGPNRICSFCKQDAEKFGPIGMWQHCPDHDGGSLLHEWNMKPGDEKLLRYLWENQHTTPFEMAGATFEIKAPIFVFREWHRHRTQSYNEMSARYTPLPNENYIPSRERIIEGAQGIGNKQATGTQPLLTESIEDWQQAVVAAYDALERTYQTGLSLGIPKELARIILPVGRYSRMRASANLLNWTKFLRLRMAKNAQWEIRQYADALCEELKLKFPRTIGLFLEGLR